MTGNLYRALGGAYFEASVKDTVVYQSIEKVLLVGAAHGMNVLSTASMDRVIPWIEALNKQYESPINASLRLT